MGLALAAVGMRDARQFNLLPATDGRHRGGFRFLLVEHQPQPLDLRHRRGGPSHHRQPAHDLLQGRHEVEDGQGVGAEGLRLDPRNPRPDEQQQADGDEEHQSSADDGRVVERIAEKLPSAKHSLRLDDVIEERFAPGMVRFQLLDAFDQLANVLEQHVLGFPRLST